MSYRDEIAGQTEERTTFKLPRRHAADSLVPSPDATRLAYVVFDLPWKQHVEVNGTPLPRFHNVYGITFSPNSQHVAYVANHRKDCFVVCDDRVFGTWDNIGKSSPVFSPDSRRVAYTAQRGKDWYAVIDHEVVGGPYEAFAPGGIVFSDDSQHIGYIVKTGRSWTAVAKGREQSSFPAVKNRTWTFAPTSGVFAHWACVEGSGVDGNWVGTVAVILDGEPQRQWHEDGTTQESGSFGEIYFSPDGSRMAYAVKQNRCCFFVVDNTEQPSFSVTASGWQHDENWLRFPDYGKSSCKSGMFSFSPDSRHYAYAARSLDIKEDVLIMDGQERSRHARIVGGPIVFSPDSQHVAYGVEQPDEKSHAERVLTPQLFKGMNEVSCYIAVDGDLLNPFTSMDAVYAACSPDSQRFAYAVEKTMFDLAPQHPLEDKTYRPFVGITTPWVAVNSSFFRLPAQPITGSRIVWENSNKLTLLTLQDRRVAVVNLQLH
jgi:hypothetical protein